jgi:hypothetical protein
MTPQGSTPKVLVAAWTVLCRQYEAAEEARRQVAAASGTDAAEPEEDEGESGSETANSVDAGR